MFQARTVRTHFRISTAPKRILGVAFTLDDPVVSAILLDEMWIGAPLRALRSWSEEGTQEGSTHQGTCAWAAPATVSGEYFSILPLRFDALGRRKDTRIREPGDLPSDHTISRNRRV
jgi:hypothetical protein